jgi:4'-phosphopantetheinyl transferase
VPPTLWRFSLNTYGCPTIATPPGTGLQFNLSHTDGLVACAVTRGMDVGVDVEQAERRVEIEWLARRSFAPTEAASVLAAPPEDQRELFFAYWTLKEAYIKARGMGLALPLDSFAFDLSQPSPRVAFTDKCPDDPGRWSFFRTRPTPEHRLALAVSSRVGVDVVYHWAVPSGNALISTAEAARP